MASTTEALIVVVVVALTVIYVSRVIWRGKQNVNLPPGPTALPIIGSLHLLGAHPPRSLQELARKYGPLMSMRLGQRLCIVASSAEAAKEFLKLQDANFSSRPELRFTDIILPGGLILHDITPVFRHLRKILVGELMSTKRLESSQYIREEEMASTLYRIANEDGPSQIHMHLRIMATNILSRMLFNKRFLGLEEHNKSEMILEFVEIVREQSATFSAVHIGDFFNVPTWFDPQGLERRFWKLRERMDRFYVKMINQCREDRKTKPINEGEMTLLDILLEQLDHPENGITDTHIKGVIWDLLSAGTDTTAATSEWAMAEVLRNPTLLENAKSELDRVVGRNSTVQESHIPDLKYIQAIVKETLRLHPPVPILIPHQNKTATKAFGYDIPAQTRLLVNVWAIGRSWEKPLEFFPERFLEGAANAATDFQGQHYEFLPFGSGRRACPGMGLASVAAHLQVASLLHAFDWAPVELDLLEAIPGVTLPKRNPLIAVAAPRLPIDLYHG